MPFTVPRLIGAVTVAVGLVVAGLAAAGQGAASEGRATTTGAQPTTIAARPVAPAPASDAPAPSAGPAGTETLVVTIPATFRLDVIAQRVDADGCTQVVAVTDNRDGDPGWTATADARGTLSASDVPGNALDAAAVTVSGSSATLPAGTGPGSVRLTGTFGTCPAWTLG